MIDGDESNNSEEGNVGTETNDSSLASEVTLFVEYLNSDTEA